MAMDEKRDPFGGANLEIARRLIQNEAQPQAPARARRKRARYPSEAARIKATYDLAADPDLREDIKDLADRLGVNQGLVVCALLRHAMDEIEAGQLDLAQAIKDLSSED